MKKNWIILSTGFALFSMFFGSGNLVFPIVVGQESCGHTFWASLGIFLTGVFVPFLGVFGMMLYKGDIQSFFSFFGRQGTFWFSLCSLALMGPFGVLARCLTVAHGALQHVFPKASLVATSIILCTIIFLLTVNKTKIVTVIGTFLTPFLLLSIAAIAFFGLSAEPLTESISGTGFSAFKNGFFQGYQTMDLLAAFFFSTFIINHLRNASKETSMSIFTKSALIGGGLLSFVYIALVFLGWVYSPLLAQHLPQEMLGRIAMESLGPLATPCICIAVIMACMTTAIVLASLFGDFLRKEVMKNKIGDKAALSITLIISFLVSTLEFSGIAGFIGPILEAIYPALILLTFINIGRRLWTFLPVDPN